jgi:hypothetical protein
MAILTRHQWLTPIILATQEAEIRRITVQSQPGQMVPRDPILKNPSQKGASGVAQGVGPEFKPQYHKIKNMPIFSRVIYKFFAVPIRILA